MATAMKEKGANGTIRVNVLGIRGDCGSYVIGRFENTLGNR